MNCRGCGKPIPDWYLHLESFKCPNCGRAYHRRPAHSPEASRTAARPQPRGTAGGGPQSRYLRGAAPASGHIPPNRPAGAYRKRPRRTNPFQRLMRRRLWRFPVWAWVCAALVVIVGMAGSSGSEPKDVTTQHIAAAAPTVEAVQQTSTLTLPTAPPTQVPTQAPTQIPTPTPTQVPTAAPTAVPTAAPTRAPEVPYEDQECWVTRTGECYHYEWCRTIDGKETLKVTIREALAHGLRSCKVCDR